MEQEFIGIIAEHEKNYPLMEIQDYVKLAYQNEFGPAHLAEKDSLCRGIQMEMTQLTGKGGPHVTEKIGNGLSRIFLQGMAHPDTDARLLAELMILTMEQHRGDMEDFERKLKTLEEKWGPEGKQWLDAYRQDGCRPVSHSENYRRAYQPHYRVIADTYAGWFPVLSEICNLLERQQFCEKFKPVVISIDGRCGSGKSSLAAVVKEVFGGNVFHMDDFYLPPRQRSADWTAVPAGNMDLERFRREILQPVNTGSDVLYRPFDCQTGRLAEGSVVPAAKLTVVEGSYSQHPLLADGYDLKIFLTCSPQVQRTRLEKREGEGVHSFFSHWMPMEERYYAAFGIEKNSDMIMDTGRIW